MRNDDRTVPTGDAAPNRTIAALSLALASGTALEEVEIDLSDPAQCRFGAYTLVERIGGGGMGVVYRAHQQSLERDVAIKLLNVDLSDDAQALARFQFEAKSAAALNHPNIVQVLEIGQQQGIAFIAMQLVRGETLADRIARERLAPKDAVALMLKLCDAVGYAHKLHLLHLDLKPANVLIDERGEPLVADFGLARRMNAQGQVQAQEVSGTPAYMAPEQVMIKEFRLSAATDIYALGAILYEMLCGLSPHGRGAPAEVIQRALAGEIPAPRQFAPKLPRDLEAICLKCLSLRAANRYPNVEALAEDLRRFANALPVSVRRPTLGERLQRWYAREPRFALAITSLFVLALLAIGVTTSLYQEAARQRIGAEGIIFILMAQSPGYSPSPLDPKVVRSLPQIDCAYVDVNCNTGIRRDSSAFSGLTADQRAKLLRSLRDYVPKIADWGNTNLSSQLAAYLDDIEEDLRRAQLAPLLADAGGTDALVFATRLSFGPDTTESVNEAVESWRKRAAARIDRPWQASELALLCFDLDTTDCRTPIARFRQSDPDNALAWLPGLPWTLGPAADEQLARAARAPRMDFGKGGLLEAALAFGTTHRDITGMDPYAFAFAVTKGRPWFFGWLQSYCYRSLQQRNAPATQQACIDVNRKVQPASRPSLFEEQTSQRLVLNLSDDPAIRAPAERRWRNARWIYSAWIKLPASAQAFDAARRLRILRERGEYAYLQDVVAASGVPLEAPSNFITQTPAPWPRPGLAVKPH